MRRGLMPVALGLRLGLEIALVFSRSLAGLLHGITATDSTIYFQCLHAYVERRPRSCLYSSTPGNEGRSSGRIARRIVHAEIGAQEGSLLLNGKSPPQAS